MYDEHINIIIQRYLLGTITKSEYEKLQMWFTENPKNLEFFKKVCEDDIISDEYFLYEDVPYITMLNKFNQVAGVKENKNIIFRRWFKYAAVFIFTILTFSIWNLMDNKDIEEQILFTPGEFLATLVLENGDTIVIDDKYFELLNEVGIKTAQQTGKELVYVNNNESNSDSQYHELIVPRGGEYKLLLSDGSKIHLNAGSTLRYPILFGNIERKVYLSGEAYFEIEKEENRPFFVFSEGMEIEVYGTSFNVNTNYRGETRTVLVNGSIGIEVLNTGEKIRIEPGELAILNHSENSITSRKVDVSIYTGWKNGYFHFDNERLENILTVLSNWYNVEVEYVYEDVKDLHFDGFLDRYKNMDVILNAISQIIDVSFTIEGRKLKVSK